MTEQRVAPRVGSPDAAGPTSLAPTDSSLGVGRPSARDSVTSLDSSAGIGNAVARDSAVDIAAGSKRCPTCAQRYPNDFRVCPRDATELEAAPDNDVDPLLGAVLNESYELVRVIGEGGMGRVYEARHKRLPTKRFAVKVLHADLARQPDVLSRFQREAEATSVLSHANIVGVVDVNRAPDGRPYIVAELLEGQMLAEYLERKRSLSVAEAVHIARQVCAALAAAHERGIVHRDIKPENVFLVGAGNRPSVKVLDFGISRVGEGAGTLTKTGMIMGTPAYMPPEQARGARVDHRADIYAVGAILYEALTGKRPFDGPDLMATLARVLSEEPARPCTLNATLPPALEMTIQRAMAKQPAERHRTMQELDAELAAFDSAPVASGPTTDESPTVPLSTVRARANSVDPAAAVRRARTHIVILSAVAAAWTVVGLLDAAMSSIRWARGAVGLSATEVVLTCLGTLALLIAPSIAWVRYVKQRIWPSTPRAVELVGSLRGILVATLVTYASTSLLVRFVEAVVNDDLGAVTWPGWAVLTFTAGNIAGAATWFYERVRVRAEQARAG